MCFSVQDKLIGLNISFFSVYNHMIRPGRNPCIIPTGIVGVCIQFSAGPGCKCVVPGLILCPDTGIFPIFRYLYVNCCPFLFIFRQCSNRHRKETASSRISSACLTSRSILCPHKNCLTLFRLFDITLPPSLFTMFQRRLP